MSIVNINKAITFSVISDCDKNEYIPPCFPCPPYICGDSLDLPCFSSTCIKNDLCYCRRGFLRNLFGKCVRPYDCNNGTEIFQTNPVNPN